MNKPLSIRESEDMPGTHFVYLTDGTHIVKTRAKNGSDYRKQAVKEAQTRCDLHNNWYNLPEAIRDKGVNEFFKPKNQFGFWAAALACVASGIIAFGLGFLIAKGC